MPQGIKDRVIGVTPLRTTTGLGTAAGWCVDAPAMSDFVERVLEIS